MKFFSSVIVALVAVSPSFCIAEQLRVAVIGAGASGVTAAYELERKGHSVTLYEKDGRVGGKMMSVQMENGVPATSFINMTAELVASKKEHCGDSDNTNLGAVYFPPDSPPLLYGDELGLAHGEDIFANEIAVYAENQTLLLDFQGYVSHLMTEINPNATGLEIGGKILGEIAAFQDAIELFSPQVKSWRLDGQADTDLALSVTEFAEKYGFPFVLEAMRPFITGYGYGYIDTLPAAYTLKTVYGLAETSSTQLSKFRAFPCGSQSLPEAMAATLEDVRLNAEVIKVQKTTDGGLEVHAVGQSTPEVYDRVIFSTTLNLIGDMMALDPTTEDLFSKLQFHRYVFTVLEQDAVTNSTDDTVLFFFAEGGYEANEDTVSLMGVAPEAPGDAAYQIVDPSLSLEEVADVLKSDMKRYFGSNVTSINVQRDWTNYFPTVSTEDFAAGYFDDLEALQGVDGIYYVGGQFSFELVANSMGYSRDLIERMFNNATSDDASAAAGGDSTRRMAVAGSAVFLMLSVLSHFFVG